MPSKDRSRARRGVLCLLAGAALMLAGAYLLAGTPETENMSVEEYE